MTDDIVAQLRGQDILCDEAADKIERLQEEVQELKRDSTIFIIERGEAIGENADLREEIERLRAALREYACNCPSGFCLSVGTENNDVCGDAARAALEASDD